MKISLLLAVAGVTASGVVTAQTERDLDSHEHGSAQLNIAVEDSSVLLELNTPWNNLVGFEHAPSTDEQHALVDDAKAQLNDPGSLYSFKGTDCVVSNIEMENTIGSEEDNDDHDHDDEHGDEHAEDHDDKHDDEHAEGHDDHDEKHDDEHAEGHDDHDEKHDDEHADGHDDHHDDHGDEHAEGEQTHSSVLVMYSFTCQDTSQLTAIDVNVLDVWSGFEELDVQLIGANGQASMELNAEQSRIDISQVQ